MTDEEIEERKILALANENGKFAIEVAYTGWTLQGQQALERLQLREWVRLIDVTPVAAYPNRLFRAFMLTKPAREWLKNSEFY